MLNSPLKGRLGWKGRCLLLLILLALGSSAMVAPEGTGTGGMLAAGFNTSCYASGDGKLYVWGHNSSSQLGFKFTIPELKPTRKLLPAGVRVTQVVSGPHFTEVLTPEGKVYGWGDNYCGELGIGSSNPPHERTLAARMPTGVSFLQLAAGDCFMAALATTGVIYTWGDNAQGQQGISQMRDSRVPHPIDMPAGVRFEQVAACRYHCLGLTTDGQVYSWGGNSLGELGQGTRDIQPHTVPTLVVLPRGVRFTQIATGAYHSLGITATGALYAWGSNELGQLGDGSTHISRPTPQPVKLPAKVRFTQVYSGTDAWFSLALTSDGHVYAWGSNNFGQLGVGNKVDQHLPARVHLPPAVRCVRLACDSWHTLALTDNEEVYSWGSNGHGELGVAGGGQHLAPVRAVLLRAGR
jgi:alpha-tubulin suppressor-like RCC1 family protein